jgi:hypothetical protein
MHSHLPYARLAAQGEVLLSDIVTETQLPSQALWGVRDEGLSHKVTIGMPSTTDRDVTRGVIRFNALPAANTDDDEFGDDDFDEDDFDDDFDDEDDLDDDFDDDDFDDDFDDEDIEDDLADPLDLAGLDALPYVGFGK